MNPKFKDVIWLSLVKGRTQVWPTSKSLMIILSSTSSICKHISFYSFSCPVGKDDSHFTEYGTGEIKHLSRFCSLIIRAGLQHRTLWFQPLFSLHLMCAEQTLTYHRLLRNVLCLQEDHSLLCRDEHHSVVCLRHSKHTKKEVNPEAFANISDLVMSSYIVVNKSHLKLRVPMMTFYNHLVGKCFPSITY